MYVAGKTEVAGCELWNTTCCYSHLPTGLLLINR